MGVVGISSEAEERETIETMNTEKKVEKKINRNFTFIQTSSPFHVNANFRKIGEMIQR